MYIYIHIYIYMYICIQIQKQKIERKTRRRKKKKYVEFFPFKTRAFSNTTINDADDTFNKNDYSARKIYIDYFVHVHFSIRTYTEKKKHT